MQAKRLDLSEPDGGELEIKLKPGMAWAIYTDHGPTGIVGQCMSITCPHCSFVVWPDEASMRESLSKQFFRKGSRPNLQYGVIGEFGHGTVTVFEEEGTA